MGPRLWMAASVVGEHRLKIFSSSISFSLSTPRLAWMSCATRWPSYAAKRRIWPPAWPPGAVRPAARWRRPGSGWRPWRPASTIWSNRRRRKRTAKRTRTGRVSNLDSNSIRSVDPDPDPGGQKWSHKSRKKIKNLISFEVLDVLFWELDEEDTDRQGFGFGYGLDSNSIRSGGSGSKSYPQK